MRAKKNLLWVGVVAVLVGSSACHSDPYDEDTYEKLINYMSPVDSVDQRHTWSLTTTATFRFMATGNYGAKQVAVFTANPVTDTSAERIVESSISDGQTLNLMMSYPSRLKELYAALIDGSSRYTVVKFSVSQTNVTFDDPAEIQETITRTIPQQAYTYLFEEDFPQAGDYDYNDLVLRISQRRTDTKQLTISVTIAAVGGDYQMAGGIRLVGYRAVDIDTVYTKTGVSFNDGIPSGSLYLFDKTDLLVEGRNREAVINLFVDAHWAMAFNAGVNYGLFQRKKYNVSSSTGDNYQLRSTRTLDYVIEFKKDTGLDGFTLDMLDPFIITEYNGGIWETHLDGYKDAQVLYPYTTPKIKVLPWALKVPKSDFAYPLEGNEIGFRKKMESGNVAMFGAYVEPGHSFGEWVEDYTKCLDWYLYPTLTYVY